MVKGTGFSHLFHYFYIKTEIIIIAGKKYFWL